MTSATSGGVKAPPQRAASQRMPWARTRSPGGSQVVKALVRLGKQPASPVPNKKRVATREAWLQAHPVAAVKNDHHRTMRVRTRRGPIQSPRKPPGISNNAYPRLKAVKAHPIWMAVRPRSWRMAGAAKEMETRSRYVITARETAKATTDRKST